MILDISTNRLSRKVARELHEQDERIQDWFALSFNWEIIKIKVYSSKDIFEYNLFLVDQYYDIIEVD